MSASNDDLHAGIASHLPYLRRFSRALTGSQVSGDRYTAATLEAIIAEPEQIDGDLPLKVALFRMFGRIWASASMSETSPDEPVSALEGAARSRLESLYPRARQAFLLKALEDFTVGEIATVMGVTTSEAEILLESGVQEIRSQTRADVLVIEDEPIIAMDIRAIVEGLGHRCVGIADTRDSAVELARTAEPGLVLADIQLSDGSSGIDAVREILAFRAVPSIFITAFPERLLTGERPEPTFLITKPFKREAIEAAISQALFFNTAEAIDGLTL